GLPSSRKVARRALIRPAQRSLALVTLRLRDEIGMVRGRPNARVPAVRADVRAREQVLSGAVGIQDDSSLGRGVAATLLTTHPLRAIDRLTGRRGLQREGKLVVAGMFEIFVHGRHSNVVRIGPAAASDEFVLYPKSAITVYLPAGAE